MSQIAEESLPSTSDSEKVIAGNGNAVDDKDYVPDEIVKTSRLEEYEKLFKNCYTMKDEMYAKIANEGIPPVICIFPYETRVTYGGDSYRSNRGDGNFRGGRGDYRGRGRGNWNGGRGNWNGGRGNWNGGRGNWNNGRGRFDHGRDRGGQYRDNHARERENRDRNSHNY